VSAVIGNHDYYAGVRETIDVLRRAGADVMVNGSKSIEGKLVLAGVDDVWARRVGGGRGPDAIRAFANTDPDLPRVLLCHNPSYYPEAADHADLQLSGHTHGGQFSPLVNPARLVLRHGYIRGRYERARAAGDRTEAKSQLYVNRGFGTAGPPARIGSPPEVSKIILMS
jgi:predicted MPP superfamily phosphohydrolase